MYDLFFIIGFVLMIILLLLIISFDKSSLGANFILYLILTCVPTISIIIYLFSQSKQTNTLTFAVFISVICICAFILQKLFNFQFYKNFKNYILSDYNKYPGLSPETSFIFTFITKMLFICMIIIGLAIIYRLFFVKTYKSDTITSLIIQLIFFIPCLASDFIKYIAKEFYEAPSITYILIFLEILIVSVYLLIPYVIRKTVQSNGKSLLKSPVFLSNENQLDSCNETMKNFMRTLKGKTYNYAISLWINYNDNDNGLDYDHNIFYFGNNAKINNSKLGKPYIYYSKNNTCAFELSDEGNGANKFEIQLPSQKWNNIVVNYHSSRCDIFINGKLKKTVYFKDNNIPFIDSKHYNNYVNIGDEKGALHGSICNVVTYKKSISSEQIANNYNVYYYRNPPV